MSGHKDTKEQILWWVGCIGFQVEKTLGKPFKSTNKINTVKGLVINKQTGHLAFIFEEDDSDVECWRCHIVTNGLQEDEA